MIHDNDHFSSDVHLKTVPPTTKKTQIHFLTCRPHRWTSPWIQPHPSPFHTWKHETSKAFPSKTTLHRWRVEAATSKASFQVESSGQGGGVQHVTCQLIQAVSWLSHRFQVTIFHQPLISGHQWLHHSFQRSSARRMATVWFSALVNKKSFPVCLDGKSYWCHGWF